METDKEKIEPTKKDVYMTLLKLKLCKDEADKKKLQATLEYQLEVLAYTNPGDFEDVEHLLTSSNKE